MATRCEVMEAAAKLSLQLEAYNIPDSFAPSGKRWQVVARVRDEYTNYRDLLASLGACANGESLTVSGRPAYDCAREVLDTEARELAQRVYRTWYAQRNKVSDPERHEKPS